MVCRHLWKFRKELNALAADIALHFIGVLEDVFQFGVGGILRIHSAF